MTAGLVLSFQIGHDPEKKKLVKSDLIKFLTFYPVKDAVKKMEKKKSHRLGENICTIHEGFISKTDKETLETQE